MIILLALSLVSAPVPAPDAAAHPGQGRVVVLCAAPSDVQLDGKKRGKCKEDLLKAAFWADAGAHQLVVTPESGEPPAKRVITVTEGVIMRVNLAVAATAKGRADFAIVSPSNALSNAPSSDSEASASPPSGPSPTASTPAASSPPPADAGWSNLTTSP